jgi:Eco57I restriction-modification methylase
MDYYIAPEESETDFLKITRPEEIRICDPAAGSGHMLTYAFDLLYAIYEEEGYDATEIPALILTHNLTGVEIDDRAGALAAFALAMKAAARLGRRRFLRMEAKPDICVLQNVAFTDAEMQDVAAMVGKDLFTDELRETLAQFEQAKNFGSLIVPKLRDPAETLRLVEARDFGGDLLLRSVQERVVAVLRMAEALSPKYHVVVANPPYAGAKGLNSSLRKLLDQSYTDVKSDLFSAFVVRNLKLTLDQGQLGFMTPYVWMFIASYEKLRRMLTDDATITSLIQLEYSGFEGATVPICTFTIQKSHDSGFQGGYVRLSDFRGASNQAPKALEAIRRSDCGWFYRASSSVFEKIPTRPIAYWLCDSAKDAFEAMPPLSSSAKPMVGLQTGDNPRFIRLWPEISFGSFRTTKSGNQDWVYYFKGGDYRRWYGNRDQVVYWKNDGADIKAHPSAVIRNWKHYFRSGVTYTNISSSFFAARFADDIGIFDQKGSMVFPDDSRDNFGLLALLLSNSTAYFLKALCPTLDFNPGSLANLPTPFQNLGDARSGAERMVTLAKADWDAYETSWDFTTLPLLSPDHRGETLADSYATLRAHWQDMTDEMKALEEENNRIFIDAYGLQDELTPEVPIEEITLTCNPAYRYGVKGTEADRETRLRADTMAEFLSYAVGCMFGRYSLDEPGLILANQGETLEDYLARMPDLVDGPSFMPDDDNVIPILDGDWFPDDITERFRKFLRVTFGEENFADNLRFIEEALGKSIRKYFIKDFYNDHIKRYKKRPIYWMFSSPKGSFNALIYMHRYRPDTVGVVLNDYLREYIRKLEAYREQQEGIQSDPGSSASAKTKALKAIEATAKVLAELDAYEREALYPLATQRIAIDLDDGVKANYPKLGAALKPIKGLTS